MIRPPRSPNLAVSTRTRNDDQQQPQQPDSQSTPPSPRARTIDVPSARAQAHPRSIRHANSSYFSIPPPSPNPFSGQAIPPYRPRETSAVGSIGMVSGAGAGAGGSFTHAGSTFGTSVNINRSETLDNWQNLQELVGEDAETDDGGEGASVLGSSRWSFHRPSQPPTPGSRSLRSIVLQPPTPQRHAARTQPQAQAVDINHVRQRIETLPSITDQWTGSPPQLEGGITYSPFSDLEEESTPRATPRDLPTPHEAESPLPGGDDHIVKTPLLGRHPVSSHREHKKDPRIRAFWKQLWPPSPVAIAIFKCSLTYLIASLFTFVPSLAELLSTQSEEDAHGRVTHRPSNQAHMVATIVVYFNPAKTVGNMLLSNRYCAVLALAACLVSFAAMGTIALFDHFSPSHGESWDWISEAGDWVVCILWIGGTMGVLAWSKVWVGNPSYNSGCSMAAIMIYSVVIKEGALPRLLEILSIVAAGVIITNVVCFTVFPSSATSKLQNSISKSLNSFSTLLDLLTSTFLLERAVIKENRVSLRDAIKAHAAGFRTLQNDLREAKQERVVDPRIRGRKLHLYDAAIASLARLAQHISSLRSSTRLQEGLIRAIKEGKINTEHLVPGGRHSKLSMSIIGPDEMPGPSVQRDTDVETSVRLFMQFREMAGSQMDKLNTRCDEALEAVQALSRHDLHQPPIDLLSIRGNLASSLAEFSESSSRAIKHVYAGPIRERGMYHSDSEDEGDRYPTSRGGSAGSDLDEKEHLADGPNETVFLVYFFLFTFEEFAREMLFLLDTMQEVVATEPMSAWDHLKSVILRKRGRKEKKSQYLYKQFQNLVPIDPSKLQPIPFPKKRRDSTGSVLVPEQRLLSAWGRAKQAFWRIGSRLGEPDMRYAIKTGIGGAMLAAPAYTEAGRPIFLQYRGEWALIAYLAAMSQTVGQTNWLSLARVVGTIIGGTVAIIFTKVFPGNNVVLPILGFFFALPCFYVITQMPDYTNAGRFILLTYNLSCLYTYNVRDRGNVTVEQIAVQRSSAVIIGVLWAAAVSRWWWPFTARRELRLGLSDFCLDLSYLYSRLVMTYSKGAHDEDEDEDESEDGETSPLISGGRDWQPHVNSSVKQFMAMELHLQSQLITLRGLLAQTKNEPRLKGPFAFAFYNEVLLSCERMLDRLHSMRCVTTRNEWDHDMRQAFVIPVNRERREMAGNVILYFYTLSAGFRTRTPLPPYLPPAEQARQVLVGAIRELDVVRKRSVRGGGRHLLFFAYATAMQEVIAELDYLGEMMQEAYGVISQSTTEDFEALFLDFPEPEPEAVGNDTSQELDGAREGNGTGADDRAREDSDRIGRGLGEGVGKRHTKGADIV